MNDGVWDNPVNCRTCRYSFYEMAVKTNLCGYSGKVIGGNYEMCKPTTCKNWKR